MFKKIICLAFVLTFIPSVVLAQTNGTVFKAEVVKIIQEQIITREDGSNAKQQDLLLRGISKEWKDKEFEYNGISDIDVTGANLYKVGDKVFVNYVKNVDGGEDYYITDYVRSNALFWLVFLFVAIIISVGRLKGVKSLITLALSFLIIGKFIVPQIMSGGNPLFITIVGALLILAINIYFTEGINKKSHLAVLSVFISLIITFILSWIFTAWTRITGMAQEEAMFLVGSSNIAIDFKGLLLAGIIIGTLGVLDDVIIGQIESVNQIQEANPSFTKKQLFKAAYKVGNAHLGAIVNTLFLTYAGASLPLLLLFYINPTGNISFEQILNNEMMSTEIIRTIVGSIGVALAMPIATVLAAKTFSGNK